MKNIAVDRTRLRRLIRRFRGKRVLVLGDLMLDKYIWGDVVRISPEAPVPVVEVRKDTTRLGGAGNVAGNLLSLGAFPLLAGVVGDDDEGRWIRKHLPASRGVIVDGRRPTTVKMRIIAHHQQVVRVDKEKKSPIPEAIERRVIEFIRREKYDGLLISDYNKGMVNERILGAVLPLAVEKNIPVFVDPKVEHFSLFTPVTLISPNHHEAEKIVRRDCRTDAQVEAAGLEILSLISCRYIIVKRGEQGMTVFERGRKPIHIPTVAKEVFDVTGAGDTVIAAATLGLLAGGTIEEAAVVANAAAGIVVGKIGTAAVTPEELLKAL